MGREDEKEQFQCELCPKYFAEKRQEISSLQSVFVQVSYEAHWKSPSRWEGEEEEGQLDAVSDLQKGRVFNSFFLNFEMGFHRNHPFVLANNQL